jgi:hypothetical protein
VHDNDFIVAVLGIAAVFGLPFLGCMIWLLLHYCFAAFRTWQEVALKREMIARGYTVQEIVEVVSAKRGGCGKSKTRLSDVPPAKPIKQPAY